MTPQPFSMPALLTREDGEARRVGVEIEMSGIDLAMIACQLNILYGGRIGEISPYEYTVSGTELGDFKVHLDFEYLQKYGRERLARHREEIGDFEQFATDTLQALMKNIVPCELASPPIPFARLPELDAVIRRLREHGAKGTRNAIVSAFGVHLNLEPSDLHIPTLLAYLRAFLCLQAWLEEEEGIAFSRKLSPFIKNFPAEYVSQVMHPDYAPSTAEAFIEDYLAHNATRNRIFDLLPLLAWLDEARVRGAVPDDRLRKRPTLHYRLPNSDIDEPGWSLAPCWNRWLQVEALAHDPARLGEACTAFRESRQSDFFSMGNAAWKNDVKQWIIDL